MDKLGDLLLAYPFPLLHCSTKSLSTTLGVQGQLTPRVRGTDSRVLCIHGAG